MAVQEMAVPPLWTEVLSVHARNGVVRRDPHARADAAVALRHDGATRPSEADGHRWPM
jgi:hypothetical protein